MNKDRKRAIRRHHAWRLKKNRLTYYSNWGKRDTSGRAVGMLLHTAALCSCFACGNARRFYGNGRQGRTLQELRKYHRVDESPEG